jgi:transcriptional regulator GlxA family with amidase domain
LCRAPYRLLSQAGAQQPLARRGQLLGQQAAGNDAILEYVRSAAEGAQVSASVCIGALILAAAGLLAGRPATTHWAYWRLLERLGARYVPEQRWVEDGKFITSAGVSARIDMALHLTERLTDAGIARMVQLGDRVRPQAPMVGSSGAAWIGTSTAPSSLSSCRPPWPTSPSCCTA